MGKTASRTAANGTKPGKIRSRVTNGNKSFVDGNGRGVWARRHRDLIELHVADLGSPVPSEAQLSLCKRASTLEIQLEALEGALSKGEDIDLDAYARVTGHLRRVLESLGIERRAKPVMSLSDYLATKQPAPVLEAAE